jgi:hypothetical protein
VIPRELGDLIGFPDFAVTGGLADKEKRPALTMHFVIELQIA